MGELYERILGVHPTKPKISTDGMQACMALIFTNHMTVAQADALFAEHYGGPLGTATTGGEAGRQEATDLRATIPTGATTANQLARIQRMDLIERIFVIADLRQAPFDTPAGIRSALGVPDRS